MGLIRDGGVDVAGWNGFITIFSQMVDDSQCNWIYLFLASDQFQQLLGESS